MKELTTYEFYSGTYNGEMTAEAFGKVLPRASALVDRMTLYTATDTEDVQLATCAAADVFYIEKDRLQSAGIASESNDGYSVTYASGSVEDAVTQRAIAAARTYLRKSRRVGCIRC